MWELWFKFYWGQNEDCSPGDSISDSSEKLLQRGGGGGESQYICDFGGGEYMQSSTDFLQKVSASLLEVIASHEEMMSPWRILVLF